MNKSEIMSGVNYKECKKVANNTWWYKDMNDDEVYRLFKTDVVRLRGDKTILDSGGWLTPTTKDRINKFSNFWVGSYRGEWCVRYGSIIIPFYDGIKLITYNNIERNICPFNAVCSGYCLFDKSCARMCKRVARDICAKRVRLYGEFYLVCKHHVKLPVGCKKINLMGGGEQLGSI